MYDRQILGLYFRAPVSLSWSLDTLFVKACSVLVGRGSCYSCSPPSSFLKVEINCWALSISHKAPHLALPPPPPTMHPGYFGSVIRLALPLSPSPDLLCWVPFLHLDPVAESWFGGPGGENVGMLRVIMGQALSRGHGVSPLTLQLSDWAQPREALSFSLRLQLFNVFFVGLGPWRPK